jgi:plasmid maintenance system antidote protein VapI
MRTADRTGEPEDQITNIVSKAKRQRIRRERREEGHEYIGSAIRLRLIVKGWTAGDLAKSVGRSQCQISQIMTGRQKCAAGLRGAIAKALGTTYTNLVKVQKQIDKIDW